MFVENNALTQCFSTGSQRNLRVLHVATSRSAETDRKRLGPNSQPRRWQFAKLDHCIRFHEQRKHLQEVPLLQKKLQNTGLTYDIIVGLEFSYISADKARSTFRCRVSNRSEFNP